MKAINYKLGGVLALIGAIIGIVGHFWIFINWYELGMAAEAAEPGCEILLKYIQPAMFDFGILGAAAFLVSAYGFFTRQRWSFVVAIIGIVLALQGSWFINVPYMAAGLPPIYFTIFWPYLALYFLLLKPVGNLSWPRIGVAFVAGMSYVFCLMNGIASLSRIITIGTPLFSAVQRLHWFAMIGFGVIAVGIVMAPKEWMKVVGLAAGVIELIVGIPLVISTTIELGRFSLFSLAPIFSLVMIVLIVWPNLWQKISVEAQPAVPAKSSPVAQTV